MSGRPERVHSLLLNILFPLGSLLLTLFLLFRQLLSPGYVIYRDLFPGQLYYPSLWHPQGSFLALENFKFVTFTGIFLPLRSLGLDVYEKAVYGGAAAIAYLAFYLAAFRLLKWIGVALSPSQRHLVSALAALTYLANPAAANMFFDFSLFVGYAFAPLSLILFIELLEGQRRPGPTIILLAALWWLSAIKAHWIVFGQCLFLPPLLVWALLRRRQHGRRRLWRNLLATMAITAAYLLFSAYWLIPFVGASQQRFVGSYAPITRDSIAFLSYTPLHEAVRLLGSFSAWPYVRFEPPAPWLSIPWVLASWVIPVAAGFALLRFRRHWQVWILFVFVLVGVLLAKGVAPPLGGLYEALVFDVTPASFRWLFRVASKWNVFVSLGYCGLVTLALGELLSRVRGERPLWWRLRNDRRSAGALLGLVGYILAFLLLSWPSFSGDFRGALQPTPLPESLTEANRWLAAQEGDFKVNWMPVTNGRELSWNRRPSGDLYTSLSARPSIGTNWNRHPVLYYSYIYESLANGQVAHLGKLLAMLNTRFLAYHDDVVSSHVHAEVEPVSVLIEGREEALVEQLAAQQDLRLAWQDDRITLYECLPFAPPLFVPQRVLWTAEDLSLLTSLDALVEFQPFQEAVLFDPSRAEGVLPIAAVDGLLLGHDAVDHLDLALLPVERLIAPAEAADRNNVTAAWSRFDIYQFDWQSVLRTHGIDYWGFDYGRGVVAHSTEVQLYGLPAAAVTSPQLDLEVHVTEEGQYHLWVRYLRQKQAGEVLVSIDGTPLAVLQGRDPVTRFVWDEIGPLQLGRGRHRIRLQNRAGFSVVNVLALVSEEEMAALRARRQELVARLPQIYLLEMEKDFVGPAEPVPDLTRFSSGRAVSLGRGEGVSTTLELLSTADYWLALRAFVPSGAGPITATLGPTALSIPAPTTADLEWLVAGPVHLTAGRLPIRLETADEVVLDAFMLYTGESPTPPEALFEPLPPPAQISYEQIDPTRYRVLVRAERPFFLVLAETYDPLWVASTADMQVSSLPLGGTVNAFFIARTGSYELMVEYTPQQWARLGWLLTLLALLVAAPLALILQHRRQPQVA